MSRLKDDVEYDTLDDEPVVASELSIAETDEDLSDSKTKRKIRIEKHSRFTQYFEDKRLREELDFIDGW